MFSYEVMSEQEAIQERFSLLKEGEYDAVVIASSDRVSSTGNPMMDITLQVFDDAGKSRDIRDFLVFTKSMMWKVIRFADSAGILKKYEEGNLCSETALGQRVRVKIGVEEGNEIPVDKLNGKPIGSKYSPKNKVEDYIKKGGEKLSNKKENIFDDSDIPNF